MNEIYLDYRFRRLRTVNLLLIVQMIFYEALLSLFDESLAFNSVVTGGLISVLFIIYIISHLDRVRDFYPTAMGILSGMVIFLAYLYVYHFSTNSYLALLQMLMLLTFFGGVTMDRNYRFISLFTIVTVVAIIGLSLGPMEEKLIHIIANTIIILMFLIRNLYESRRNKAYYELFSVQKHLIEHMENAYALCRLVWDDTNTEIINHQLLSVNPVFEQLLGYSNHEVVGKSVSEIIPEAESYWMESVESILMGEGKGSFVNYSVKAQRYYKVTVTMVEKDKYVSVFGDITDVIEREKELKDKVKDARRANDFKSQFLRDVNHKLRTPLNGMMGMAQLIAMEDLPGDTRELFDVMVAEMDHSRNILNQIAEYIDLKEETYQITQNDMAEDISQIIGSMDNCERCVIDVKIGVEDTDRLFYENAVFTKVLKTLIANGLKHSDSDTITVRVEEDRRKDGLMKFLLISVADHGKGISQTQQKMIFNQLHHQDFINIYRDKGHMSLPLCKELVKHIGGDLSCTSNEDEGAVFTIRLPIFEKI